MERWLHLAELLSSRPIMPGCNEVDWLHKIYKLCGSPSEEYWKKIRLPSNLNHANQMADQQFKRKVRENYKYFYLEVLSLVDRLLALDPLERLTAKDALMSDLPISNNGSKLFQAIMQEHSKDFAETMLCFVA